MEQVQIDKKIITRYRSGDREAFRTIYERTSSLIYNAAYKVLLNEEDARDIAHDTYVTAFEKRDTFREESSISTWLYRIAVNKALNFIKRKKKVLVREDLIEAATKNDASSGDEHMVRLMELLEQVPADHRICLTLREVQHLSYEEIAAALKINIGTVRSRINRGRKRLIELYNEQKKEGVTVS